MPHVIGLTPVESFWGEDAQSGIMVNPDLYALIDDGQAHSKRVSGDWAYDFAFGVRVDFALRDFGLCLSQEGVEHFLEGRIGRGALSAFVETSTNETEGL